MIYGVYYTLIEPEQQLFNNDPPPIPSGTFIQVEESEGLSFFLNFRLQGRYNKLNLP